MSKFSTVIGDTHAAQLDGGNTLALDSTVAAAGSSTAPATNTPTGASAGANLGITETEVVTASLTPTIATNRVIMVYSGRVQKITNTGTITTRMKKDGAAIRTSTSNSLTANQYDNANLEITETNVTAAAHTYNVTVQASTTGMYEIYSGHVEKVIQLSGSDTHSASLTGSEGSCL